MRVLVQVQPLPTHLSPLRAIIEALTRSGHEVVVATHASQSEPVRRLGVEHLHVGLPFPDVSGVPPEAREATLKRFMMVASVISSLEALTEWAVRMRPDVVLVEPFGFAGSIVAEQLGLPCVLAAYGIRPIAAAMGALGSKERSIRHVEHGFEAHCALRDELGLPPDPDFIAPGRDLVLDLLPPSLHFSFPELMPQAHRRVPIRFRDPLPMRAAESEASLRRGSASAAGSPTRGPRRRAHVTFGTVFQSDEQTLAISRAICDELGIDVIAQGASFEANDEGRLRLSPWVNHDLLLPEVDVLVHHGGLGTTMAAIAAGVPTVVIPVAADQPTNAARIQSLGAGLAVVRAPSLDAHEPRGSLGSLEARVVRATSEVLHDPLYRGNAERLRAELKAMPEAAAAVSAIEELVRDRRDA